MVKYMFFEDLIKGVELGRKRREFLTELREKRIDISEADRNSENMYYKRSMEILGEVYDMGLGGMIGFIFDRWLNREDEQKNALYLNDRSFPR